MGSVGSYWDNGGLQGWDCCYNATVWEQPINYLPYVNTCSFTPVIDNGGMCFPIDCTDDDYYNGELVGNCYNGGTLTIKPWG